MDKLAPPSLLPSPLSTRIFAVRDSADRGARKRVRFSSSGADAASPLGPSAPVPFFAHGSRIGRLKTLLAAIERRHGRGGLSLRGDAKERATGGWTLGAQAVDAWLPGAALAPAALGEIKPSSHGDWSAAVGFSLALTVRLLHGGGGRRPPLVVWCWPTRMLGEAGRPYGPGLAAFGLDPAHLLMIETTNRADTLWAMEEALRSGAATIVLGALDAVASIPARRLALAAEAQATPCLLLTGPLTPVMPATAVRWRVSRAPSGPHPFDPDAPGSTRLRLTLERCRGSLSDVAAPSFLVEWHHESHCFGVVAGLADRAVEAA